MTTASISNIIIAGSRNFCEYEKLAAIYDKVLSEVTGMRPITIFSGGATGTDHLGERYAFERGYNLRIFKADWIQYGKCAGPIRNNCMVQEADMVICFWNGQSKGTKHMISVAHRKKLQVYIFKI